MCSLHSLMLPVVTLSPQPIYSLDGRDGLPGRDGRDGVPGNKGERGNTGLQGPPGPQGIYVDGMSLYMLEVNI